MSLQRDFLIWNRVWYSKGIRSVSVLKDSCFMCGPVVLGAPSLPKAMTSSFWLRSFLSLLSSACHGLSHVSSQAVAFSFHKASFAHPSCSGSLLFTFIPGSSLVPGNRVGIHHRCVDLIVSSLPKSAPLPTSVTITGPTFGRVPGV